MQRAAIVVLAVVALVVLVGLVVLRISPPAQEPATPTREAGLLPPVSSPLALGEDEDDAIPGVESFEVASADHVEGPVDYPQNPPVGGPHNPVPQECGVYDAPVLNEHAVHSLEHGAVWITYRPDLSTDQVGDLRRLAERNENVLVSPYPDLPAPVVASAWGEQLKLERADDPRLRRFVRAFAGFGPEAGASCSGGMTETVPLPVGTPAASPAGASPPAAAATPETT